MSKPGQSLARPKLQLEAFFAGRARGWGFMHSRLGGLSQQFEIEAEGRWDEGARTLLLSEDYRFDDGHRDVLKWQITRKSPDHYVGKEPRLKGKPMAGSRTITSAGATPETCRRRAEVQPADFRRLLLPADAGTDDGARFGLSVRLRGGRHHRDLRQDLSLHPRGLHDEPGLSDRPSCLSSRTSSGKLSATNSTTAVTTRRPVREASRRWRSQGPALP